jgi:hypothetical protein
MKPREKRKKQFLSLLLIFCSSVAFSYSSGISVDAGLTPAQDRWIFRTQIRYMSVDSMALMNQTMGMYMMPVVLAYGLKSNLTILCRQPIMRRDMSMMGASHAENGFGDLFVMGKFKIYRRNTQNYTFGMAATIGIEAPTGSEAFSSKTWDLQPGLYFSWRRGSLGSDVSISYAWNGFVNKGQDGAVNPGNEFAFDWAVSYQFSPGMNSRISMAPVLEVSYKNISSDRLNRRDLENSGESILYISPGFKFTMSSLILEALLQLPVAQNRNGIQMERNATLLFGLRYMF